MNWPILAIVISTGVCGVAIWTAYVMGKCSGERSGFRRGFSRCDDDALKRIEVAERNAELRGIRKGIDQQKNVIAERARDAARRDGKGRFKKR